MKKEKTSKVLSFTFPPDLILKLEAVNKTGHYDSVSEFIRDSIRSFLHSRKDLRISIAHHLFRENKISFSKAVEIIGTTPEEVKLLFEKHDL